MAMARGHAAFLIKSGRGSRAFSYGPEEMGPQIHTDETQVGRKDFCIRENLCLSVAESEIDCKGRGLTGILASAMKIKPSLFLIGALLALSFNSAPAAEQDDAAEVKAWSEARNARTRAYLDKLSDRAAVEKTLTEWFAKTSPSYSSL